jgi:predicted nucleotidyltransferase component of viral defense system
MIPSAQSLGFSPEAQARDRSQMAFLSSLMRQGADRYILKGGMAMRALYGSARLSKDVDFDCADSIPDRSLATPIPNALEQAARSAGIVEQKIDRTKSGERASRWRLAGRTRDGTAVTREVEISRRGVPAARFVETRTIQPPYEYTITPFVARVYSDTAMAAAKVNALLSDNRSVPRDVYDLDDLIPKSKAAKEMNRDPDADYDLTGR